VGAFLLVGIIAAIVAFWGVTTQRAIARRRATLDHIARTLGDRSLLEAHRKFIQLAKAPGGLAQWADEDKEQTEDAQTVRTVLNEFELIAIGIQRGIIDYQLWIRWFRSSTILYWGHGAPFVFSLRTQLQNDAGGAGNSLCHAGRSVVELCLGSHHCRDRRQADPIVFVLPAHRNGSERGRWVGFLRNLRINPMQGMHLA
jgi:Domain of unknown function (DUF4760)